MLKACVYLVHKYFPATYFGYFCEFIKHIHNACSGNSITSQQKDIHSKTPTELKSSSTLNFDGKCIHCCKSFAPSRFRNWRYIILSFVIVCRWDTYYEYHTPFHAHRIFWNQQFSQPKKKKVVTASSTYIKRIIIDWTNSSVAWNRGTKYTQIERILKGFK